MNIEEGNCAHAIEPGNLTGTSECECSLMVKIPSLSLDRLLSVGVGVRPPKNVEYAIEVFIFECLLLKSIVGCEVIHAYTVGHPGDQGFHYSFRALRTVVD